MDLKIFPNRSQANTEISFSAIFSGGQPFIHNTMYFSDGFPNKKNKTKPVRSIIININIRAGNRLKTILRTHSTGVGDDGTYYTEVEEYSL